MKLFSRTQPVTRAKRKVTHGELRAAIAAATAELDREGTAVQTLERLLAIDADDDDPVTFDGPAPISVAELDEVLANMQELDASTLSVLKRARVLVANAETKHAEQDAKAGAAPVSRAEFEALLAAFAVVVAQIDLAAAATPGSLDARVGIRLERIAKSPEAYGLSGSGASTFRRLLLAAMNREGGNASASERRHARRYPGQPWAAL